MLTESVGSGLVFAKLKLGLTVKLYLTKLKSDINVKFLCCALTFFFGFGVEFSKLIINLNLKTSFFFSAKPN